METKLLNRINKAENYEQLKELVRVIDHNNIKNDGTKRITNDDRNRLFMSLINKAANIVEDTLALETLLQFIIFHDTEVIKNKSNNKIDREVPNDAFFPFKQNLIDKIVEIAASKKLYILFLEFYYVRTIMESFAKYKLKHNNIKSEFDSKIIEHFTSINNNNYGDKVVDFMNTIDTTLINQKIRFQCLQIVFDGIKKLSKGINIFKGNDRTFEMFFIKIMENYQSLGINKNIGFKNSLEEFIFNRKELGFLIVLFSNIFGKDFDAFINKKNPEEQAEIGQNIRDNFDFFMSCADTTKNTNVWLVAEAFLSKTEVIKNIILNKFLTNEQKNTILDSVISAIAIIADGNEMLKKVLRTEVFEIIRNASKLNNSENFSFTKQTNDCFNMDSGLKHTILKLIFLDRGLSQSFSLDFISYNFKNELNECNLMRREKGLPELDIPHDTNNKIEISSFIKEKPLTSLLKIYENEYCGYILNDDIQQIVENFDKTHDAYYINELEDFFIVWDDLIESFAECLSHDYFKNCFTNNTVKTESLTDILAELGVNCKAIGNYLLECHKYHREVIDRNNYNIQQYINNRKNEELTKNLKGAEENIKTKNTEQNIEASAEVD